MARAADAIADNADGELFVDSSCIDCDRFFAREAAAMRAEIRGVIARS